MITNKIIQEEIEEIKQILKQGDLEIPSMWTCLWPGLGVALWLLMCSYLGNCLSSYNDWDKLTSIVFSIFLGLLITIGSASGRASFLSIPNSFRKRSQAYKFFGSKIKKYTLSYMFVMGGILILTSALSMGDAWGVSLGFVFSIAIYFIFHIDMGRYQLSMLSSVINACKSDSVTPTK
ncbi:conjugal transfer protein TraS [Hafnia alvei]|uniref:conjugal transfer protein TraS n=1 Tax=Hafnia alvei TaxID=569 RepID=UPI0014126072|nr:conjugal transfer protein TraS [Hafnia alvei]QIP58262.1 conjugal transfer protein TraS [Hafnia alvei]